MKQIRFYHVLPCIAGYALFAWLYNIPDEESTWVHAALLIVTLVGSPLMVILPCLYMNKRLQDFGVTKEKADLYATVAWLIALGVYYFAFISDI